MVTLCHNLDVIKEFMALAMSMFTSTQPFRQACFDATPCNPGASLLIYSDSWKSSAIVILSSHKIHIYGFK